MSIFDNMFKKNKLDEAMDEAFENITENNPITRKAKQTIEDAGKGITKNLEKKLYGEVQEHPEGYPSVLEDFDSVSANWDNMIDQLIVKEFGKYKVCPNCNETVPSDLETCPHCNTPLPDITAAFQLCPKCGAKNKILELNCAECGAKLDVIPEEDEK